MCHKPDGNETLRGTEKRRELRTEREMEEEKKKNMEKCIGYMSRTFVSFDLHSSTSVPRRFNAYGEL